MYVFVCFESLLFVVGWSVTVLWHVETKELSTSSDEPAHIERWIDVSRYALSQVVLCCGVIGAFCPSRVQVVTIKIPFPNVFLAVFLAARPPSAKHSCHCHSITRSVPHLWVSRIPISIKLNQLKTREGIVEIWCACRATFQYNIHTNIIRITIVVTEILVKWVFQKIVANFFHNECPIAI